MFFSILNDCIPTKGIAPFLPVCPCDSLFVPLLVNQMCYVEDICYLSTQEQVKQHCGLFILSAYVCAET